MVHTSVTLAAIVSVLSISTISSSAQTTVSLTNSNNWCMFLPPASGQNIGEHEDDAVSYCISSSAVSGARTFPSGLIQSAHFVSGSGYVQVTGQLNPSVYLNPADEGGQFDSAGAPVGGVCSGYPYFINLVEPVNNRYCIRCCNTQTTDPGETGSCLFNHSTYGCEYIIGGDYSGPGNSTSSTYASSSSPASLSSMTLPPSTSLSSSSSSSSSPSQTSSSSSSSSSPSSSSPSSSSSSSPSDTSSANSTTTTSSSVKAINTERVAATALSVMLVASLFLLF